MTTYGNTYDNSGSTATATEATDTKTVAADAAKQTAGTAKDQAAEVASTAKAKTGEVAATAKEQGLQVVSEAKSQAQELTGQLRTQANDQAVQQRDRAAETLRSLSGELRSMADNSQGGTAKSVVSQVAGHTESLADYLERREPGELVDDLRDMARRRPGAFLAGAAIVGVVAGRLMKGVKAAGDDSSSRQLSSPKHSRTASDDIELPGGPTSYGSPAGYVQGDPLATTTYGTATGHSAEGERMPTTGPLAGSVNDPFRPGGYS